MEDLKKKPIYAHFNDQSAPGSVETREFSSGERITRGLKIGGILWLAAIISVFVPILHFILVPLFLLLGLVFGFAAWHDRAEIVSGTFTCPVCKAPNQIVPQSESFPKATTCSQCHIPLTLKAD